MDFNYKLFFDCSPESIIITSPELEPPGPIIFCTNPAFTKLFGYTSEEVVGRTPRVLQGPVTDRKKMALLKETLCECKPYLGRFMNYKKDGTIVWVECTIFPIFSDGKLKAFGSIQRNITNIVLDEERLTNKIHHLEQSLESRKIIERAKGLLMIRMKLSEDDAHKEMQHMAQKKQITMLEIAKSILLMQDLEGINQDSCES
jgi:PAS domain S-box-containing protein